MRAILPVLALLLVALTSGSAVAEEVEDRLAAVLAAYDTAMTGGALERRQGVAGLSAGLPDELRKVWEESIQPGILALLEEDADRAAGLFGGAADHPAVRSRPALQAFALRLGGRARNMGARHDEALEVFRDLAEAHADNPDPAVIRQVVLARNHYAATLAALARHEEDRDAALAAYRDALALLAGTGDRSVRRVAAATQFTVAMLLEEWDRNREAVWAFDEFEAAYPEYATREAVPALAREAWHYANLHPSSPPVAGADGEAYSREPELLLMQAQARLNAGAPDEAIALYDLVLASQADGESARAGTIPLQAMLGKGRALESSGQARKAIPVYENLFALCRDRDDAGAKRLAVLAMSACGSVHGRLGDDVAALDVFTRMLARYEKEGDPIIAGQVAGVLLLAAKIAHGLEDSDAALAFLDRLTAVGASRPEMLQSLRDEAAELRTAIILARRGR